jgi:hypothetical protein
VNDEQSAKLKKLAKPFSITKKQSTTKIDDDLLSEVSTPGLDIDLDVQKKYIDSLLNRRQETENQANRNEEELKSLLNEFEKASEISETHSQQSMSQQNFYKPMLKQQKQTVATVKQKQSSLVIYDEQNGTNRLDNIYKQL